MTTPEKLVEQRLQEGHIRFAVEPDLTTVMRFIEHLERSAGAEGVFVDADECAGLAADLRVAIDQPKEPRA